MYLFSYARSYRLGMEEKCESKTFCIGCFCENNERHINYYTLQCSSMKELFKTPHILVCYLCKRMLQRAETFIQNVQSNQILLENFNNVLDDTVKLLKLQVQPLVNLQQFSNDMLELSGKDGNVTEKGIFSVICNQDVNIKTELKEETGFIDAEDIIDGNDDFQDMYVKEEELTLAELLKEELGNEKFNKLENQHLDIVNLPVQLSLQKKDKQKIKMVYLTREKCNKERLQMAMDQKYLHSVYKCLNCIKGFPCKKSYDIHMEKHNQCIGDYECDLCKIRMDSKEKLANHMRYHEVRYKCMECGLIRKCKESITNHYTTKHLRSSSQHVCPKCSKSFKRNRLLSQHISRVHNTKGRVECAYCNRTYCTKDVLRTHMLLKHTKEISAAEVTKNCVCSVCGQCFKTPSQLRYHSIKHSDIKDFYCVECDKRFKSQYALKYHLKTASLHVDNKELPLACSHCDKRFSTRRDVTRHTNRIHLNVRPYRCDKCDKAYSTSWGLKDHQRYTHDGHKRPLQFPCPMCDKVFTRNQILKDHIRTHTGERPYQCGKCPATFNQASILRTHDKRVHHNLRPGRTKTKKLEE